MTRPQAYPAYARRPRTFRRDLAPAHWLLVALVILATLGVVWIAERIGWMS